MLTSKRNPGQRCGGFLRRFVFVAGGLALLTLVIPETAPAGNPTAPTFDKDVAPILFRHCVNCHRPGQIASAVPLLSYDAARPWAQSIREKVSTRAMPPWPADPRHSMKFRKDARLSQQEIDTVVAWVAGGAPKGNDADLPPRPPLAEGWLHPQGIPPDLVITLPESQLPAVREIPYLRYLVKVPLAEDKWVAAMQVLPGNSAVVHHMAITELALAPGVTPDNIDKLDEVARKLGFQRGLNTHFAVTAPGNPALYDMLGVYTPGTTFEMFGNGSAKLLKGGANFYLNCNIHYQTTGKPEKDQTRVGFWFQAQAPQHQLFRVPASGASIIADGTQLLNDAPGEKAEGTTVVIPPIPAYAENYELIGITAYTEPITIYQLQPHAHLRGKDFRYDVVYPDGSEQTILSVPDYDFHWQLAYELETPLKLPAGSKLVVTAHYDNSLKNQHLLHHHEHAAQVSGQTPGPKQEVHFRGMNQSWDEMFTPFIQYTIDNQRVTTDATDPHPAREPKVEIAQVEGCLEQEPSGTWTLSHAGQPSASTTQGTTASELAELKEASTKPSGGRRFQLLGISVFNPMSRKGEKVAVKGVLIEKAGDVSRAEDGRLNVTSLQTIAERCF